MIKKISDMTAADKAAFLEKTKRAMLLEQGVPWEFMEAQITWNFDMPISECGVKTPSL